MGTNVHSWGNGIESDTDYDGFYVNSGGNIFTNWQSETNLGSGLYVNGSGSRGNEFTDGKSWANGLCGIDGLNVPFTLLEGTVRVRSLRNALPVTVFRSDPLVCELTRPKSPRRRTRWRRHTRTRADLLASTRSLMPPLNQVATYHPLGAGILSDSRERDGCHPGVLYPVSKDLIADAIIISDLQEITSVLGHGPGRRVTLIFTNASAQPVRDNGTTLNLNGDFTPAQNDVLSLISDGTNWYEVGRSAN